MFPDHHVLERNLVMVRIFTTSEASEVYDCSPTCNLLQWLIETASTRTANVLARDVQFITKRRWASLHPKKARTLPSSVTDRASQKRPFHRDLAISLLVSFITRTIKKVRPDSFEL